MEKFSYKLHYNFSLFLLVFPFTFACDQATNGLQTYIIHVHHPSPNSKSLPTSDEQREDWYKSFLPLDSRLVYSYHNTVTGFAARLTQEELANIEKTPGFLHAYPDRVVPLLTTRTPQFLGLDRHAPAGLWKDSNFGEGVIVGVIDTGVSPDLPSFRDNGVIPPPPANKWKGGCEFGVSVCNNKLIGARNFVRGMNALQQQSLSWPPPPPPPPPYDSNGHGTHTASTAAGMFVDDANIEGQANGKASGTAPYSHLAVYKVCSEQGCATSDIMAGMDAAIHDGVDVMSLSLAGSSLPYHSDGIAIGAFAAAARGVFVSCAAGNSGPWSHSLANEAPWVLTVGAGSLDRRIRTSVTLGNGKQFDGESVHQPTGYPSPSLPLVYPGSRSSSAAVCGRGTLSAIDVKGKIVVCDNGGKISGLEKGATVKDAGGAGMIIANLEVDGYLNTFLDAHVLPESTVSYADGVKIKSYIGAAKFTAPTASITFNGTEIGPSVLAPVVPYFSSRGPNQADPKILKPDIIGPGVNVLAAWPSKIGTPGTNFKMMTGTSMSTPHLSGTAALLKSTHPDWSPAAIKSAIMTTAYNAANNGRPIPDQNLNPSDLFATGAGHVDPAAANSPGLIYDLNVKDYTSYLCGLRYTDRQVSVVVHGAVKCSDYTPVSGSELNYPSFMVFMDQGKSVRVTRTVTNVGAAGATYTAIVAAPVGASVTVEPETISFSSVGEKVKFSVTFTGSGSGSGVEYSEGYLTWVSSEHRVNSPIMVAVDANGRESI